MIEGARKLATKIPQGRISKGVIALTGGTVLAQIITACAMPIVTRLYAPAEIGVISLFLSFFGFWSSILSWRYESALLIAKNDQESYQVFRVGYACVTVSSFLAMPVLAFLTKWNVFGFGLLPSWSSLVCMPILFGYGQFMMYRSWGLRAGMVKLISRATIARAFSNVAARIVLGFAGWGVPALFVSELCGAWGGVQALRRDVRNKFETNTPAAMSWYGFKEILKKYSKFPMYEMPSMAINQVALGIPVPMLASLYGIKTAGLFGLARLIVVLPEVQIGKAVGDIFQMELANALLTGKRKQVVDLFYKFLKRLSLIGIAPLVLELLLSPWAASLILGRNWSFVGVMIACISPWFYVSLVATPLARSLSVLQLQQYKLIYDVTSVALSVGVWIMCRAMNLKIMECLIFLTAANTIAYIIYLMIIIKIMNKFLKVR